MLPLRVILFAVLIPGTVLIGIPWLLLRGQPATPLIPTEAPRVLGLVLIVAGGIALLFCIRDFAVAGRGTLAPIDPPRHLVRVGLYRYVRNPMYVAALLVLAGEALFFESETLGFYAGILALAYHLFVVLYEEPRLRDLFSEEYENYRRAVPRWIPRLHPYDPTKHRR